MPPDSDWRQFHPLTPLLHSGRLVLPVAIGLLQTTNGTIGRRWVLPVIAVAFAVGGGYGFASWRRARFRLTETLLELETGVLQRRRRRLPLARLESVDLRRGLLARALGLAEVHVEAVSTGESEVVLSYLTEEQAEAVRAELLARRAGTTGDLSAAPAPAPETVLVAVPAKPLVLSALLLPAAALAGVVLLAAAIAIVDVVTAVGVLFVGAWTLAALTLGSIARLEGVFGFTLSDASDGLRIRRGLLNLRSQTVPAGRVQAVRVVEPLLWRPWGWVRVLVDVAGYRGGDRDDRAQTSLLLPIAPRSIVGPVLARVLPGLDLSAIALSPAPARARWRAPLSYGRLGIGWTDRFAVTRRGRLRRVTDVVPHLKVQSLRVVQDPLQRRLGLASLRLDTPGTSVSGAALHRELGEALALAEQSRAHDLAARSRSQL